MNQGVRASVGHSTLLTSPLSFADFLARLVFFAVAPFAIVIVAELFPVRGALIDVGLALAVFIGSEFVRRFTARSRVLRWLLAEALEFESHYRELRPRPFAYYVFYPLLFPYWLSVREARREFLLFRSYTLFGLLLLVGSLIWQYVSTWAPELSLGEYLPFVLLSLLIETLLVLALLMPIATTVVWYHGSFRRRRLLILLFAGLFSTAGALLYVTARRDPIVSYATRERVRLRTAAAPARAHRSLRMALRSAMKTAQQSVDVEGDGKIEGAALAVARGALSAFYKPDEAQAFDLWASPRNRPRLMVIYFEARRKKRPIWVALAADGSELRSSKDLPAGAFRAMRQASGDTDDALWTWPDDLDVEDDDADLGFVRSSPRHSKRPSAEATAQSERRPAPKAPSAPPSARR